MERLTYTALEQGRYDGYLLRQAPERVLQFGEGNFLRGFAEHFIDVMNERTDFQGKWRLPTERQSWPCSPVMGTGLLLSS